MSSFEIGKISALPRGEEVKRARPPAGEAGHGSRRGAARSKAGGILYKAGRVPNPRVFKRALETGAQLKNAEQKQLRHSV